MDVFAQIGYSTYEPKHIKYSKLISYNEMNKYIEEARIVITHGGPASFVAPLQVGKIPIVVPRKVDFGEHVNNHQLDFAKKVSKRQKNIIVISDIDDLGSAITEYENIIKNMNCASNTGNKVFNEKLKKIVYGMF